MFEYRFLTLTDEFREILEDAGLLIIEEEFKKTGVSYVLYGDETVQALFDEAEVTVEVCPIEETGWETRWKEYLEEGWLNKSLYFIFDEKTFDDSRKTILINPSFAFGTGTHGTTRAAAHMMEPVCNGAVAMDVGCGSAILAIAAAKLGAEKVYAFDIDDVAMINAQENIAKNGCSSVIHSWAGTIESVRPGTKVDVLIANIISSVLKMIHPAVVELAPEYIVYSGILIEEKDAVMEELTAGGYVLEDSIEIDEWFGMRLRRENGGNR